MGTHTGFDGASMWDVRKQARPKLITTTGKAGKGTDPDYDGLQRLHPPQLVPPQRRRVQAEQQAVVQERQHHAGDRGGLRADRLLDRGLLPDLAREGAQPRSAGRRSCRSTRSSSPTSRPSSRPACRKPTGTFCSSHWFDYRRGGIVAVGFYGGGTQFVDVSNPADIKSYGYAYWGGSAGLGHPLGADLQGRQADQRKSNVAYSIDLVRGLDVYSVDVGDGRGTQPSAGLSPDRSASDRAAGAVLPLGLVGGALALTFAVRRRTRRA